MQKGGIVLRADAAIRLHFFARVVIQPENVARRPPMARVQRPQRRRVGVADPLRAAVGAVIQFVNPVGDAPCYQLASDDRESFLEPDLGLIGEKTRAVFVRLWLGAAAVAHGIIVIADHRHVSARNHRVGQFLGEKVAVTPIDARPVEPGLRHGLEDRVVMGLPIGKVGLERLIVSVRLIADGETIERVGVVGSDVGRQPRGDGRVAVPQAEGVDHFYPGSTGESKKRVDVLFLRTGNVGIVDRCGADAQALDSQRAIGVQQSLVLGIEIIFSIPRQHERHLVAQAHEPRREFAAGSVVGDGDRRGGRRGWSRAGLGTKQAKK